MTPEKSSLHYDDEYEPGSSSPFIEALVESIGDLKGCEGKILPILSPRYVDIQERLIEREVEGVTVFHGGPLDLRGRGVHDSWLTPVEVRDEYGFSNFHVITVGCNAGNYLKDAQVHISTAPEVYLKLGKNSTQSVDELKELLLGKGDQSRIIIRPSVTGSLAFPLITTPVDVPPAAILRQRIRNLLNVLDIRNVDLDQVNYDEIDEQRFELAAEYEHFWLAKPKIIDTPVGNVWVYGVLALDDLWRYCEIFSLGDLNHYRDAREVIMRTDSGCDIGMLYSDLGCDCHPQLMRALEEAQNRGGIVVHIPTQDGRGYGMNTKMETEAYKRGMSGKIHRVDRTMKTIEAAKLLFGEDFYDIRTYDSVAYMLAELGFRKVTVITDNNQKLGQMRTVENLTVEQEDTNTLDHVTDPELRAHIIEKHNSRDYIHHTHHEEDAEDVDDEDGTTSVIHKHEDTDLI